MPNTNTPPGEHIHFSELHWSEQPQEILRPEHRADVLRASMGKIHPIAKTPSADTTPKTSFFGVAMPKRHQNEETPPEPFDLWLTLLIVVAGGFVLYMGS